MHFDPREQAALRAVGLDDDDLRRASERVRESTDETADALREFFDAHDELYADLDRAHSDATVEAVDVDHVDLYTHGGEIRGYLRFDSWGAYVEGGRVLSSTTVELSLGPTVDDRVRFAVDREDV